MQPDQSSMRGAAMSVLQRSVQVAGGTGALHLHLHLHLSLQPAACSECYATPTGATAGAPAACTSPYAVLIVVTDLQCKQ